MVSEFMKKKLLHLFNTYFDSNANGSIDKKDIDKALEKVAQYRGLSNSDIKYKELSDYLDKIWAGLQSRADSNKDDEISEEEWICMWKEFGRNPASAADWQNLFCEMVFAAEDASRDGSIDSEEYSIAHAPFGIDKEEAVQAFQKMSKGKSTVSWPEFQELFKDYFVTEDLNAPGNYIFGITSF